MQGSERARNWPTIGARFHMSGPLVQYLERARYVVMKHRRSAAIRRLGGDLSVRSKSSQLDWFRREAVIEDRGGLRRSCRGKLPFS